MDERIVYNKMDLGVESNFYLMKIEAINYDPPKMGKYTKLHSHKGFEAHFVMSGKGRFIANKKSINVSGGIFHIIGPDMLHEQYSDTEDPVSEFCVRFDIIEKRHTSKKNAIKTDMDSALEIIKDNPFYVGNDDFGGSKICKEIFSEIEKKEFGTIGMVKALIERCIILMARNIIGRDKISHSIPDADMNTGRSWYLDRFFRDYKNPIPVQEAADMLGICTRQFDRIVKKQYGMSYSQKIKQLRIDISKQLLEDGQMSLSEIASYVGYETQQYFSKQFKDQTGCTPRKYRENYLKGRVQRS